LRLRLPDIEFVARASAFAPRPASLHGARVGFVDGWGERLSDGGYAMYPTMAALEKLLRAEHGIGEIVWHRKDSVSRPVTDQVLAGIAKEVDVVINGEGL
jgi:hypothetical protein